MQSKLINITNYKLIGELITRDKGTGEDELTQGRDHVHSSWSMIRLDHTDTPPPQPTQGGGQLINMCT